MFKIAEKDAELARKDEFNQSLTEQLTKTRETLDRREADLKRRAVEVLLLLVGHCSLKICIHGYWPDQNCVEI